MAAAKQLFGSMWWRMAVAGAGLVTASFEPMHAQIKWMQSPNGEFVLSPISNSPRASALPQKLAIADLPKNMYPSRIPHFTVQPDQTIIWDATGWCIEAAGNTDGAEVRINRCTSGPAQLWDCLPQTKQIRLKGTNSCLHVNDEAGLNGAPVELRACDGVASWDFSDSEPLLERSSLSYTRHALIVLLSMTALGLSLGAWRWKQLAKANHTIASLPSDMDEGGVSLSDPLAGHQGSRSSILEMDLRQQKMVPTVMTVAPSQVKPKKALRTPTPEMAQRIFHFSDPRSFGLGTILVDDEDDDISKGLKKEDFGKGLVSRPRDQKSNSQVKFPHFEVRRAFGVTPIIVDEIPLEDRFAARSPDSEDGNGLPMEPTTATDVANMAASAVATPLPIDIEGEDDDDSPLKNKIAATSPVSEDVDGQPLIPMDPITAADVASMGASAVATPSPIDIENEDDDEDEDLECAVVDPADTKVVADPGGVGDFPEGQDLDELFDVMASQIAAFGYMRGLDVAQPYPTQINDVTGHVTLVQIALHYGVEKARALKMALDSFEDDIQKILHKDLNWDAFADDFRVVGKTGEVAMDLGRSQWHILLVRAMCLDFIVKEKIETSIFLTPNDASNRRNAFVNTRSKFEFDNREGGPVPRFWQEAGPVEITMEASFHFNSENLIDYMQVHDFSVNGLPLNSFPKLSPFNDIAANVQSMGEWMNGIKLHDLRPWWTPFASYLTNIKQIGQGNYANVYLMDEICPPSTVPITVCMKELVPERSPEAMVHNEIDAMKSLGDFVRSDVNIRRQKIGTAQDFSPYCVPLLAEPKEQDQRIYLPMPYYNMGSFQHIYENPDRRRAYGGDKGMYALVLHVARGVKALHGAGWAHHDLHGCNVMVSCGSGQCLTEVHASIIDLGLATRLGEPLQGPRGMIHCHAPEMLTCPESSDKRKMDVWALGMLLWEIRFGWQSMPLEYLSPYEAKEKLLTLDFKNADDLPPLQGEPEIANLLSGMLTADPSQRWHLDQVIDELEKIAHPHMLGPHESPLVTAGALSDNLAPPSRDPYMALGVKVELVGMEKSAQLNGLIGTIMNHDESRKLYKVQMEQGGDLTLVGESNVRLYH